ncbi:MAG: HAD family phosphatase [Candidatus Omnitrophica bacterium]|nr:HAD family phosphatase [Candidatus Omnitrophota bacterium]
MKLKGIIFDGDGVLFDTEKLHVIAWKKVFLMYNINPDSINFEEGIGVEDYLFLKNLKEKCKIPNNIPIEKLVRLKNEKLLEIVKKDNIEISEKIKEILKFLKGKFKLAIASNSEKRFIIKVIEKLKIVKFFDVITTKNDVKNPKPFPDIYILTSKKLHISPENLIAFEDSETGIISAKKSGIFCAGVKTTSSFEKLKLADIIIDELNLENVKKVIEIFEKKDEN